MARECSIGSGTVSKMKSYAYANSDVVGGFVMGEGVATCGSGHMRIGKGRMLCAFFVVTGGGARYVKMNYK